MKVSKEQHKENILNIKNNNILLELPTSFGKSKLALDILKERQKDINNILLVVPRIVLKDNWIAEFYKWNMDSQLPKVTMTTYVSLPKHAGKWDMLICDEAHHLSERCREALTSFDVKYSILLSATVGYNLKDELKEVFENLYVYKVTARQAIDNDILPDPKVYLLPMELNKYDYNCYMIVNPKAKKEDNRMYSMKDYWNLKKYCKDTKCTIRCTEMQYYDRLDSDIEFYRKKSSNPRMKNIWLHKCGERLKWLSDRKTNYVARIIKHFKDYRTLTFCNGIEQTEVLGKNHINSKNKESNEILKRFNNGEINHITACNMLNEGMNLSNCQIGIYANLNSSETIVKQRLGRILRHDNPIIIIPYFKNTRDEELVNKMIQDYNPELVKTVNDIKNIEL